VVEKSLLFGKVGGGGVIVRLPYSKRVGGGRSLRQISNGMGQGGNLSTVKQGKKRKGSGWFGGEWGNMGR